MNLPWRKRMLLFGLLLFVVFAERESDSDPVIYIALGDSITSTRAFTDPYRQFVQTDLSRSVTQINLGIAGATSADLLDAIKNNERFRLDVSRGGLITLDIGFNDFNVGYYDYAVNRRCGGADDSDCLRNAVLHFMTNYSSIVSELQSLVNPRVTAIRLMDVYNPYTSKPAFDRTNPYLDEINNFIHEMGAKNHFPVADLHLAFNGARGDEDPVKKGYLADGIHPNARGGTVIADQLRILAYLPLAEPAADAGQDDARTASP